MPPGLLGLLPVPGSLKGEPGLVAELPGVVSPRSWQDWPGWPGGPGGLSARTGLASPSEKKAMIKATNRDLRTTLLLLSGDAPAAKRGPGRGRHLPITARNLARSGSLLRRGFCLFSSDRPARSGHKCADRDSVDRRAAARAGP